MSVFIDDVTIKVQAGRGGRGAVSFRREKYLPNGGPDGGDGGRGGNVVAVVDHNLNSLARYQRARNFKAESGGDGSGAKKFGKDGDDVILTVPPGTSITDAETGAEMADLTALDDRFVLARGGRGGRGNARFANAVRQAPRTGELGEPGEQHSLRLQLKVIADIGFVGLPNAGKSTLLAALTGAHPKIAAYPFTTLHPNLGVAEMESGLRLVLADIPGLIEGAHAGAGLGIQFLRHLQRTRVLIHVIDAGAPVPEMISARAAVEEELRAFSPELAEKPAILALNKCDLIDTGKREELAEVFPGAVMISATEGDGVEQLLQRASALLSIPKPVETTRELQGSHRVYRYEPKSAAVISQEDGAYRVSGIDVERIVAMTDLDSDEAVLRLQRTLKRRGIENALVAAGCQAGDTVRIGQAEFTYQPG